MEYVSISASALTKSVFKNVITFCGSSDVRNPHGSSRFICFRLINNSRVGKVGERVGRMLKIFKGFEHDFYLQHCSFTKKGFLC